MALVGQSGKGEMSGQVYKDAMNNTVHLGNLYEDKIMMALKKKGIFISVFKTKEYQFKFGECREGIEIKYDRRSLDRMQLSIEVEERKDLDSPWVKSGILKKDNSWLYVQGNDEWAYIFMKKILVHIFNKRNPQIEIPVPTIKTFFIDISTCNLYGELVDLKEYKI